MRSGFFQLLKGTGAQIKKQTHDHWSASEARSGRSGCGRLKAVYLQRTYIYD